MKRFLLALAGLTAGFGLMTAGFPCASEAQQGGGYPYFQRQGSQGWYPGAKVPGEQDHPFKLYTRKHQAVKEGPEPNRDILISPELGEWMILVCSYTGPQRNVWARQMVAELRGQKFRLPAYVFNYGREQRLKEERRIEKYIQEKRAWYNEQYKKGRIKELPDRVKIRYRRIEVKEEAGVLIGGYKDMATAKKALDALKKLAMPDPKKVKLDQVGVGYEDKETHELKQKWVPVNPFLRAFVVRNPALPHEEQTREAPFDIALLRRLNADESYSLLKCPKKVTLVLKVYRMPTMIQQQFAPKKTVESLIFGNSESKVDGAAKSAHNLAKLLREMKFEAYVLHTKSMSLVTIGGFDDISDPRVAVTKRHITQVLGHPQTVQVLRHMQNPRPMLVPR